MVDGDAGRPAQHGASGAASQPELSWDDLRLFLSVARLGGLSAASRSTRVSAATLGRRITALEQAIGEKLFIRSGTGYRLTATGEGLLARAEDVEAAMRGLVAWRQGVVGEEVVRVSAGTWTSDFLSRHVGRLWQADDRLRLELVTANMKVDIGRRAADIGIRSARPTEPGLAGRLLGKVAYGLYSGRKLINGIEAGLFVGVAGEAASLASARWLEAHHGDRIGVRGNDPHSVRELIASGAGLGVLPCFVGDSDPRLVRATPVISELETEQWLVTHHEDRHLKPVRRVADRIVALMAAHRALFSGESPQS